MLPLSAMRFINSCASGIEKCYQFSHSECYTIYTRFFYHLNIYSSQKIRNFPRSFDPGFDKTRSLPFCINAHSFPSFMIKLFVCVKLSDNKKYFLKECSLSTYACFTKHTMCMTTGCIQMGILTKCLEIPDRKSIGKWHWSFYTISTLIQIYKLIFSDQKI